MIWLSSYPNSGSTYMCYLLQEVYGVESSVHHNQPDRAGPLNFFEFPVVQTPLLPQDLEAFHRDQPSVYIVKDGREAILAAARQQKVHQPKAPLHYLMLQAILADKESYHGGWSRHVIEWIKKADVILRFEDIKNNPIRECEKLREIIALPQPNAERIAHAEDAATADHEKPPASAAQTGTAGSRIPGWMHRIFWRYHGEVMVLLGYQKSGQAAREFDIAHRKQRVHGIFHDYPPHTLDERIKLILANLGMI